MVLGGIGHYPRYNLYVNELHARTKPMSYSQSAIFELLMTARKAANDTDLFPQTPERLTGDLVPIGVSFIQDTYSLCPQIIQKLRCGFLAGHQ